MHNNVVSPRSMDVIFKKFDFVIEKGLPLLIVVSREVKLNEIQ